MTAKSMLMRPQPSKPCAPGRVPPLASLLRNCITKATTSRPIFVSLPEQDYNMALLESASRIPAYQTEEKR